MATLNAYTERSENYLSPSLHFKQYYQDNTTVLDVFSPPFLVFQGNIQNALRYRTLGDRLIYITADLSIEADLMGTNTINAELLPPEVRPFSNKIIIGHSTNTGTLGENLQPVLIQVNIDGRLRAFLASGAILSPSRLIINAFYFR